MNFKIRLAKFKTRLIACWHILSKKKKHWVLIDVDDKNLVELFKGNDFYADVLYHGVQPYVYYKMIKMVADSQTDVDMICAKAEFEAEALKDRV